MGSGSPYSHALSSADLDIQHVYSPFEELSKTIEFANDDEKFWWRATASSLSHLLAQCRYETADQFAILRWYAKFIAPALGPRPIAGRQPLFQPCPVSDGSAVEHSINWKELSSRRLVRFTIEATSYEAGTPADPFNQKETLKLLQTLKQSGEAESLDLGQFETWAKEFFFQPETAQELLSKLPPGTPCSQTWIAFDLLPGKRPVVKVYFMPFLKWIHTGTLGKDLVLQAALKCNGKYGTYDHPIAILDKYLKTFPEEAVNMAGIDCVDSPDSRIKVYLQTRANTLDGARRAYTLSGQLSGDVIDKGLEALCELWSVIFRLQEADIGNTTVFPKGTHCGLAVEMKPGRAELETKLYLPVRKLDGSDADLCDSLASWFRKRGHGEFSTAYKEDLMSAL